MRELTRRMFLQCVALPAALGMLPRRAAAADPAAPEIIDTNVHLFDWPFRKLKYARTRALVEKLRQHRVTQAWAGSYEGLLHKNLDAVNARLAEECQVHGDKMLLPFGTINLALPDWEEDLRRCHEKHRMPGIRLYPSYHNYTLQKPEVARLLDQAGQRKLLVQIAVRMEDPRVHLPVTLTPPVDVAPLPELLAAQPGVKVQLLNGLNATEALRNQAGKRLIEQTQVVFDHSHLEGVGGLGKLLRGDPDSGRPALAAERVAFGSHAPYFPCFSAVFKLFESPLGRPELAKIMRGNAEGLLKG